MIKRTLRLTVFSACVVLLMASLSFGFDFSKLEESVTEHTLDNGLKIVVMERHDAPVVSFITYCNVGGANDPKEYTGLAHMFEHMAFKGSEEIGSTDLDAEMVAMGREDSLFNELRAERRKGRQADSARLVQLETEFNEAIDNARQYVVTNDFGNILEREGGVGLNAGTGMDQTMYMVSLPSNKLELWMYLESDRFLNSVLREMYSERNVIAEERRQTLEANPIGRLLDQTKAAAFMAHPYGISIVGHMSDIQNYSRSAAKAYYDKYYVASNMIISIVGDVKAKDAIKMAEEYWGRLPKRPAPEVLATVEPEQKGERRVILTDPSQPVFVSGWHVPEGTHPDWPAVEAMMDYFGQGRTSLLYKNLVKEKKIASQTGAFAGYPGAKYPTLCLAFAMPSPNHTNAECEEQIFLELEKIKTDLLPADEVEKIKARAKAGFINGLDSNMGLAMALASAQYDWGDWREMFRELDRINAVTAEDIQRVANKYFTKENRTVGMLNTES